MPNNSIPPIKNDVIEPNAAIPIPGAENSTYINTPAKIKNANPTKLIGRLVDPKNARAKNMAPATPGTTNPVKMNSTNINKTPKINNINNMFGLAKKLRKFSCTVIFEVEMVGFTLFNLVGSDWISIFLPSSALINSGISVAMKSIRLFSIDSVEEYALESNIVASRASMFLCLAFPNSLSRAAAS